MRKGLLMFALLGTITFWGCQGSSNRFLAYEDSTLVQSYSVDNRLTHADFFAKNIVVVPDAENIGGDELITTGAALLINMTDNELIYADKVYDKMYPASLTKLLTALVVLQYGELTDSVTVSYDASHIPETGARICGYAEGDIISMEALLNSLLIYSGNDAAIAIADHIGGDEATFVDIMNEEAQNIGAIHSNFINSHGLHDDNQYSTAYDIYLIFNELLKYDTFRSIISSDSYTAIYSDKAGNEKQKTFNSTNLFLKDEEENDLLLEVVGGKTGTTSKAGNCLILLCKDSDAKEYISVILKAADSDSLYSQMSHLISKASAK